MVAKQHQLNSFILSDAENDVAKRFGLRWNISKPSQNQCKHEIDDDYDSWSSPIFARFIIDQECTIRYAEYAANNTEKSKPFSLIDALKTM